METANHKKIYQKQFEGKEFKMVGSSIRFLFGPCPNENAIIIRTRDLCAESEYPVTEVLQNILTLQWILI